MVQIGFLEKNKDDDMIQYFERHGLFLVRKMEVYQGYQFYEAETIPLRERGICCFGEEDEANADPNYYRDRYDVSDELYSIIKQNFESNSKLLHDDGLFWLSLAEDYIPKYGSIAYYRYYEDMNTPTTVVHIKLDELTYDNLLRIDPNQILIIYP